MDKVSNHVAKVDSKNYDYDLVVIGGGSGGMAAASEAAALDAKVALLDYVTPTPRGTTWGLGGTCVNVGCVPKKLIHQAGLLGNSINDARFFGWDVPKQIDHKWITLRDNIQKYIASLNWAYRVELKSRKVDYINSYGEVMEPHIVKSTDKKKNINTITAKNILLATGSRPRYPNIPGAKEYCLTNDDLFSLPHSPGKTLIIGGGYVALEMASFMLSIGLDTTLMVRSIFLRGFDQQCANKVVEHLLNSGCKIIRGYVPTNIEQIESNASPTRLKVYAKSIANSEEIQEEYKTVLLAIGRSASTKNMGLESLGIKMSPVNGKLICENNCTSVSNIFAVGDIVNEQLELTPLAIQSGRLLAKRLFGNSTLQTNYDLIPITVFTQLEYGICGFSEEEALEKFGEDNIDVYHSHFWPLEWTVAKRGEHICYAKLVCLIPENERVIGFHLLSPNSCEITQGFAMAMRLGATKSDFDSFIGIHPTCAEIYTMLRVTKRSGQCIEH